VARAIKRLSKKKNITELQLKYGILKEKAVRLQFTDVQRAIFLRVRDGHMEIDMERPSYDINCFLSFDTFMNIIYKRQKRLNPKSNEVEFLPYTFMDAYRYDDITIEGEASLNDVKIFVRIFDDHVDEIKEEMSDIESVEQRPADGQETIGGEA
jgi:hypothetical protein